MRLDAKLLSDVLVELLDMLLGMDATRAGDSAGSQGSVLPCLVSNQGPMLVSRSGHSLLPLYTRYGDTGQLTIQVCDLVTRNPIPMPGSARMHCVC